MEITDQQGIVQLMVIFGNISFADDVATIERVDKISFFEENAADEIANEIINNSKFDSFIIPDLYAGDIIMSPSVIANLK